MNMSQNRSKSEYVIYGKPACPYCQAAKMLLNEKEIRFKYMELGKDYQKSDLLALAPSAKTVPQIFVDGKCIGGYDELKRSLSNEI